VIYIVDPTDIQHWIQEIETSIEDIMWTSVDNEDYEKVLREYEKARRDLESIDVHTKEIGKERNRVLSYCLMRINDTLENLGRSDGSIKRAEESLRTAEASDDRVQILRSKLALGVALLNSGELQDAESHITDIILQTQDETENKDVIQVYGWTLIVRVNIYLGKSLYNQAKEIANHAVEVLSGIENYAGLRTVCSLLSRVYQIEGDNEKAEDYRERSADYGKLARDHRQ